MEINSLKNTGRPTIAYLSTLFSRNRINNSIWEGVRQAAEEENMNVVCLPINPLNMPQNYYRMANILLNLVTEKIFDGILVWGSGISNQADPKDIDAFFKSIESFPMVNIGQNFPGIPGIIVDNYNGMYDLCEHIIQHHGCRRPAFHIVYFGYYG